MQVGYDEFVGDFVLLFLVNIDQYFSIQCAHCTGDEEIPHAYACVDEGETDAVHNCTFRAAFVLYHGHEYFDLVFFVEICYDGAFEAFAYVFCEFTELSVLFVFPFFEGTEGGDCVFDSQEEVAVAGTLVGSIDET